MSKGRHRLESEKIIWKFVRSYYKHRYYTVVRPALRKFFNV